jgi:hypothetical protein
MPRKKSKVRVKFDPCQGCRHIPDGECDIVKRVPNENDQQICRDAGWREGCPPAYRQHSPSTGDWAVALEILG